MKGVRIVLVLILGMIGSSVFSQVDSVIKNWSSKLEWKTGTLTLELEGTRRTDDKNRLAQTSRQASELVSYFPELFPAMLFDNLINSRLSFRDLVQQNNSFHRYLVDMVRKYPASFHSAGTALQSARASWVFKVNPDILDMVQEYSTKARGTELPFSLLDRPSRTISSLVIYANDSMPWHGMGVQSRILPALFPEILDEQGNVVISAQNLGLESLAPWGMLSYTDEAGLAKMQAVLGNNPYVIRPKAVFGVYPVNPMISAEDIETIKSSSSARKAIKEGRIILVMDPTVLEQRMAQ